MPIRIHRKRLFTFLIFLLIICFYLINYLQKEKSKDSSTTTIRVESKETNIDWHDYEAIEREKNRTGPGERGTGVEQQNNNIEYQQLYQKHGFNAFISDRISLDRSLKDIRHPE